MIALYRSHSLLTSTINIQLLSFYHSVEHIQREREDDGRVLLCADTIQRLNIKLGYKCICLNENFVVSKYERKLSPLKFMFNGQQLPTSGNYLPVDI